MQPAGTSTGRPERGERGDRFDRPRFRQDLLAELVDEQGARFIDVMDPDSGNLFRFYEVEYSLACAMDGERDVPGIVKWAQEELGLTPSQQEVRNVIATLGDLGFIDSGAPAQADLAPGVVVGNQPMAAAASQVDLGGAGAGAPPRSQPVTPAPEFALGAPGAAARRSHEPVEDVPLGAPGRRPARATPQSPPIAASAGDSDDVSLDLADHIAVGRAEVQEAVRASKVMAAVEVPQSVLDAIEDRPTARAASPAVDRPPEMLRTPEPRPEMRRGPEPRPEMRPDMRPDPRDGRDARDLRDVPPRDVRPEPRVMEARVGKPPLTRQPSGAMKPVVELPKPPVVADKPAPAAAPPKPRVSPILLVVLVLAAIGGAAFLVSRYLTRSSDSGPSAETAPPPKPVVEPPAPPPPPPPPPPVTAKIAMETPPADDVKATRNGVIETIMADKSTVKAGDVVVKLVGDKPIEAELANISRDVKRLQDAIAVTTARRDAAQTAGNKAAEAKEQAQLDTQTKNLAIKQDAHANKMTELDKFLLHAPSTGTFTPSIKLGKKIAANDVVATIQRDPTPIAMFKVPDVQPFAVDTSVELGVGTGEQRVVCNIAAIQDGSLKVACPADPALTDGAEVTLKTTRSKPEAAPTDTPTPPAPGAPGAPPPGAGSAAPEAPGGAASMPTTAPAPPPAR